MAGGVDSYIKVTTEDLRTKADTAETRVNRMKQDFEQISSLMSKTKGYWVGEAGDLYRTTYQTQDETISEIMTRLAEYPTKLLTMAGVYEPAESKNIQTAGELKNNLL